MNPIAAPEVAKNERPSNSAESPWWAVPSWFLSLTLHGTLLLIFASSILSGGGSPRGKSDSLGDAEFREVGLVERTAAATNEENPADNENPQPSRPNVSDNHAGLTEVPPTDEAPPLPLPAAGPQSPVVGPGNAAPGAGTPDVRNTVRSNGVTSPAGAAAAGIGIGNAEFFGVKDKATRVVYVIDCSGSMTNYNAIRAAKSELMASLQGLERTQQFQVLFYNQTVRQLALDGDRRPGLYFATEINRTLARQFIDSVPADLGTDHMPALRKALNMNPEVIFFLTDADEPQLTARELNEIHRLNQGKTRIHCIEFGKGGELVKVDNFLKRLARQNGGSFRYRDVTRFQAAK